MRALVGAAGLAAAVFGTTPAKGAECLPGPVVVPGLYGPPVWLGAAGGTDWRPQIGDPRWSGSPLNQFQQNPGGMESTDGMFRVLVSGSTLYVAFEAMDDTSLGFGDVVYFGFTRGTAGTGAYAVKITVDTTTASVSPPAASVPHDPTLPVQNDIGYIDWFDTTNATGATPTWMLHAGDRPGWLTDVATWKGSPGIGWGVTFKIDLGMAGAAGAMRLFHGMVVDHGGTIGALTLATPVAASGTGSVNGDSIIPISPGVFCDDNDPDTLPNNECWQSFDAPGTACSAGISFDSTDIGVWNGSALTNQIQGCSSTGTSCPTDGSTLTNKFRVNLHNVPSGGITAHAVRAHIRIADWGSTIADPNAPWNEIPLFTANVFTAAQGVLTGDTSWAWSYNSGTLDATIDYTCKGGANDYCPKLPGGDDHHQCMLVELGRAPGVGPEYGKFVRAAVYRNMDYTGLSSVDRTATVSIKGLLKKTGEDKDRDVYLHLIRKNMPAHGDKPLWLPAEAMVKAEQYAAKPPAIPPNLYDRRILSQKRLAGMVAKPQAAVAPKPAPGAAAPAAPKSGAAAPAAVALLPTAGAQVAKIPVLAYPALTPHQVLSSVWPTYEVKTYYDTGKTYTVKGQARRVLQPMAPFGLYMAHDGPLYGFTDSLEALDGVRLEQIAPDWWVARKIKCEGSFRVRAKITAEESPKTVAPGPGPGPAPGPGPCPTCGQCPDCKVKPGACNCVIGRTAAGGLGALAAAAAVMLGLALRRRRQG
jgi:hypothetical protein